MFFIELEPIFNNDGAKQPFDYSLDLSDFAYNGGFPFDKGVKVSGCVKNSTGIVTIEAKAEFTLNLNCDRCAERFSRSFSVPIEHTLVTEVNDETNDELIVVASFRYDLDPLVTEDIILYLPTKILCKENCAGVCPQCGKNLNNGPCGCKKATDPRWDILSQLVDEDS